jgi:hypothetical protein
VPASAATSARAETTIAGEGRPLPNNLIRRSAGRP